MEQILRNYILATTFSAVQTHRNLSLFPLISEYRDRLDYLTLEEALSRNLVAVTEVSEGGSVPLLRIANLAETPVLIIDGEELVGAKQNRVVNTTILIAAGVKTEIPVSCVEQGRWSYKNRMFKSEGRILSSKIRADKAEQIGSSLKKTGRYTSDQQAIWGEIKELAASLEAESPSMEMAAIYRKERPRLDEYTANFTPLAGQLGAVFVINGRVAGVEAFGKPGTFSKLFKKIVDSYAIEAINTGKEDFAAGTDPQENALYFLAGILACGIESRPSVGLGIDLRLESILATGFALVHEGQLLHISAFSSWKF